jgi:TRAP-type C4-dicarboxylate transport system permease small subunit
MKRLMLSLRSVSQLFAIAGGAVALSVALLTTYSVLQRALTSRPVNGDIELVQAGIALSISLCLAWCQLHGGNILVDFFTQKLRPGSIRFLDGIGALLIAVMYALLAWRTSVGALTVYNAHEMTMALELPMWWTYACLAPGLALAGLIALMQAWMHFMQQDMSELQGDKGDALDAGAAS